MRTRTAKPYSRRANRAREISPRESDISLRIEPAQTTSTRVGVGGKRGFEPFF